RVQDDLFMFVNGEWLKHTPIPDDKSNYGSFTILSDEALVKQREIIEECAAGNFPIGSDRQKVGDFYRSFMNEELINERGLEPLRDLLTQIDQLDSVPAVVEFFGKLQPIGIGGAIGFYVDQDDKDSTRYLAAIVQSGTTLPDRDYYLNDDQKYIDARQALRDYVVKLYELAEFADGAAAADAILKLESQLAEVQWERTELRIAEKRYNKQTVADLVDSQPGIPWRAFLQAAGAGQVEEINVVTPSFFTGLEKIVAETPLDAWKHYLRFNLLDGAAPFLTQPFVDANFDLHAKALAGVPAQKPRWKRAVESTAGGGAGSFGVLGDSVGRLFVERHFTPAAKERMDELVKNLLKAYEVSINELTWMTPETKQRAQEKLKKITTKIGYPDKWRDYSALDIKPDDLIGNILRSNQVEHQRMLDKLGKPVDKDEWGMTPQTVNAYYNPGLNEIVFPAAILQPPFFNPNADDAVNYGGIGAVIGHEISHGFDDQGSKYDGDGNLSNWWSDADRAAFTRLTQRLVEQFNSYEPLPGKHVNGELTLGENIADLSGMSIALKAYHMALNGQPSPVIDDWSGEQRFFLGWSQAWRRKYRDAEMVRRLLTDPHSPSHYRANGPVINLDEFQEAFQVKDGDQMYLPADKRIRIW
ncbi:MAG: M13 family metallopeptidase, partial [Planctomycetales bacterium]|nr:M13 family metallopeptidase [Planctomycetales bacterium]